MHVSFLPIAPDHPSPTPGLEFVLCFQGIKTGQCMVFNGTHKTCEIRGWCPVENSTVPV